jgi:hypothetical protein
MSSSSLSSSVSEFMGIGGDVDGRKGVGIPGSGRGEYGGGEGCRSMMSVADVNFFVRKEFLARRVDVDG